MKKIILLAFVLVLLSTAVFVGFIRSAVAEETIYIRADGSVEGTTDISTVDNVTYTFTDNIFNQSIVVERDNIVVDGAGYTLQGTGSSEGIGINLKERSNVTIKNMEIKAFHSGIHLSESYENTISENNITNIHFGIWLRYSSNFNNISGNNILNSYCGIELEDSSDSTISGNNITNNERGICLFGASNNNTISGNNMTENSSLSIWLAGPSNTTIIGNNITNNLSGMILDSSNSVLRNNNMTNNEYNFAVSSLGILGFINDVDISNTVNGKPVYYWINKRDMNIPIDAGYVALVNCTRITVQNLSLTHNGQGILLAYTTNSTVTKDDITNNGKGIDLFESSNNTIIGNNMTNSNYGIQLINSSNNNISENNMTNNSFGIRLSGLNPLSGSSYNIVSGNNIKNNEHGVQLDYSSNNTFYHNNFINNFSQVFFYMPGYVNFWNNDVEGNYWSNYNGIDDNQDGIGDSPYVIDANNTDNYPLMGMFYDFTVEIELGQKYHVYVISNSTVSSLQVLSWLTSPNEYLQPGDRFIRLDIDGENGTFGFCRIMIPRIVLNNSYVVLADWLVELPFTELPISNSTHAYLYFEYTQPNELMIVPEFPTWTSTLLILIMLTVAIAIYKRRLLKTPIH
jgi:parallel beta-helix repeat protein